MSEITISAFTALFGVIVYVIGQAILKSLIEPIQEHRKLKAEIAFAFVYYANVVFQVPEDRERVIDASDKLRTLASELHRGMATIPFYRFWAVLGFVPKRENILKASSSLVGWSNSLFNGRPMEHRKALAEALKIDF